MQEKSLFEENTKSNWGGIMRAINSTNFEQANQTITELVEKHIVEEQERFAEMEEELKWYEKALGKKKKK